MKDLNDAEVKTWSFLYHSLPSPSQKKSVVEFLISIYIHLSYDEAFHLMYLRDISTLCFILYVMTEGNWVM